MHETMRRLYQAARELRGAEIPAEVARLLDVPQQVLKNWEYRGISKGGRLSAQEVIGCRAEWIKDGSGPMSIFGLATPKSGSGPATHSVTPSGQPLKELKRVMTRLFPRLRWEQVTELQTVKTDDLLPIAYDESPFSSGEGSFTLELGTESMAPEYRPGEVIQVDPSLQARHGDDIIALVDGRPMFRRLIDNEDGRHLQALNSSWPDRLIRLPESAKVMGVVVASWMKRRR